MNIPQQLLNKPPPGAQINFSHPLARGLVGCWLFNEQSGNQAYDSSPYRNHGTLHGFNDPSSKDRSSLGLQYDGSATYVNCGTDPSLNIADAITIETWVNITDLGVLPSIVSGFINAFQYTEITLAHTTHKINWHTTEGSYKTIKSDSVPNLNEWIHIAGTINTLGEMFLFVDGVLQTDAETGAAPVTNLNWYIGKNRLGADRYFNGTIYYVRIYNHALSAAEIRWSYQEPYAMFYV